MPYKSYEDQLAGGRRAYNRNKLNPVWVANRKAKARERYKANPTKFRLRASTNYHRTAKKFSGTCSLCGFTGSLVWDHDHLTGEFRGWICRQCNLLLGHCKDRIDVLKNCIEYLGSSHSENNT